MILFLTVCLFIAAAIIFVTNLWPCSQKCSYVCFFSKFSRNGFRQKRKEIVLELGQDEKGLWLRKEMSPKS